MRFPLLALADQETLTDDGAQHFCFHLGLGIVGDIVEQDALDACRVADDEIVPEQALPFPDRSFERDPRNGLKLVGSRRKNLAQKRRSLFGRWRQGDKSWSCVGLGDAHSSCFPSASRDVGAKSADFNKHARAQSLEHASDRAARCKSDTIRRLPGGRAAKTTLQRPMRAS